MSTQPGWQRSAAAFFAESNLTTVTTVCELLGNRRRQLIIMALATREDWIPVSEVARWTAAVLYDQSPDETRGTAYKNIRESMRHTHLNALEDAGVIEINDQQTEVRRGPQFQQVAIVLLHVLVASL